MTKERPILFNGEMVRATLDGRKTQTRRIVKGIALEWLNNGFDPEYVADSANTLCPFGKVGDRLWVRETWNLFAQSSDREESWPAKKIPKEDPRQEGYWCIDYPIASIGGCDGGKGPWRPSIHMPRWASRITLEITGVRVERLQDISENDAVAEGCFKGKITKRVFESRAAMYLGGDQWACARDWYADLWESIEGEGSWAKNPWVWVVEFTRVEDEK